MGYKLDVTIERQFYDEIGGKDVYCEAVRIRGTSVCDTVSIEQDGDCISLTLAQFEEMMLTLIQKSVCSEIRDKIKDLID